MSSHRGIKYHLVQSLISIVSYPILIIYKIDHAIQISCFIKRLRDLIYSIWISKRFMCKGCRFRYPINYTIGEKYYSIGKNTVFGRYSVITAWDIFANYKYNPSVIIGKNCCFGDYLHLTCVNQICIGNAVLTGRWVTITDNSHGTTDYSCLSLPPNERKLCSKGPVKISDNVWIGDKVTILPGVTIGKGAVIAANSVVTKDIPPYTVVAGIPAKTIKTFKQENGKMTQL